MFRNRKYKSGTNWCVWRWTDVDSEYITRLHLIKTPWFAACLHWINKPDPEPYLHDHPVSFLSIVLRGMYVEYRSTITNGSPFGMWWTNTKHVVRRFNFVRASENDLHSIRHVLPGTLTLVFMGPKVREWGFHAPDGWVHWKDYYQKQRLNKA
jgi:hypothetical protein